MKWIIQEDLFAENYPADFEEALGNLGLARGNGYEFIKYIPFAEPTYLPLQSESDVIVYGTINLLKQAEKYTKWQPGAGTTWENYRVTRYYTPFKNFILNSDAYGMFLEDLPDYVTQPMFIRPNDGDKVWIGGVYDHDDVAKQVDLLISNGVDPATWMWVAAPKQIKREGRFFVVDGQLITGSLYKDFSGRTRRELNSFSDLGFFVETVLAHTTWRPDPIFAIDVCAIADSYKIVEISPFHCAGLYACDVKKLITAVHKYYVGANK